MKPLYITLLLSLLFLAAAPQAHAGTDTAVPTGQSLIKMCASRYDTDYGFCAGYISAISNAMTQGSIGHYTACGLATVRSQQAVDIFTNYARQFPEDLSNPAAQIVAAALAHAFPCPRE